MPATVRSVMAVAVALVVLAPGTAAAAPTHDSAKGGGILVSARFGFDAFIAPDGLPRGSFSVTVPNGGHLSGKVTCLTVQGNRATIGGRLEQVETGDPLDELIFHGVIFMVEDNGHPEDGTSPDRMSPFIATPVPPPVCPPPLTGPFPFRTIRNGNIEVRDA